MKDDLVQLVVAVLSGLLLGAGLATKPASTPAPVAPASVAAPAPKQVEQPKQPKQVKPVAAAIAPTAVVPKAAVVKPAAAKPKPATAAKPAKKLPACKCSNGPCRCSKLCTCAHCRAKNQPAATGRRSPSTAPAPVVRRYVPRYRTECKNRRCRRIRVN